MKEGKRKVEGKKEKGKRMRLQQKTSKRKEEERTE